MDLVDGSHQPYNLKWPLKTVVWLAFGWGMIILLVSILAFISASTLILYPLMFLALALTFIAPLISGCLAAHLAAQRVTGDDWERQDIGYLPTNHGWQCVLISLYRLRILFLLVVGLMPALVLGMLHHSLPGMVRWENSLTECMGDGEGCPDADEIEAAWILVVPSVQQVNAWAVSLVGRVLVLWATNILAAMFGSCIGMSSHRSVLVVLIAFLAVTTALLLGAADFVLALRLAPSGSDALICHVVVAMIAFSLVASSLFMQEMQRHPG